MCLQFLTELFSPYDPDDWLLAEIRTLPTVRETTDVVPFPRYFDIDKLPDCWEYGRQHRETLNVYVGVLPRIIAQRAGGGGHDEDIHQSAWLWVDVDRGTATDEEFAAYVHGMNGRIPRPYMAVASGSGGVHFYWRLKTIYEMRSKDCRAEFTSTLKRLVAMLGKGANDLHADSSCSNPSRILRLPHTFNHKHEPTKVQLAILDNPDLLDMGEWNAILPFEPRMMPQSITRRLAASSAANRRSDYVPPKLLEWAQTGYPEGRRHTDIVGAAAWLRRETDLPENVAFNLFLTKVEASMGQRQITEQEIESAWKWAE